MIKIIGNESNITCKAIDEHAKINIDVNIPIIKINAKVQKVNSMAFLSVLITYE